MQRIVCFRFAATCLSILLLGGGMLTAEETGKISFSEDFENGASNWEPTDAKSWEIREEGDGHAYHQFNKRSKYKPPHRSPYNIALLKGHSFGDFELNVKVRSTHKDYNHRDCCLFFGYQNPGQFYYVHLGKRADPHANQIFIVNKSDRTKISETTTEGTNWDDAWHNVKIVRKVKDGLIEIYFDDMKKPVMTAHDTNFKWGRVGLGSFDDTSAWDDFKITGDAAKGESK